MSREGSWCTDRSLTLGTELFGLHSIRQPIRIVMLPMSETGSRHRYRASRSCARRLQRFGLVEEVPEIIVGVPKVLTRTPRLRSVLLQQICTRSRRGIAVTVRVLPAIDPVKMRNSSAVALTPLPNTLPVPVHDTGDVDPPPRKQPGWRRPGARHKRNSRLRSGMRIHHV